MQEWQRPLIQMIFGIRRALCTPSGPTLALSLEPAPPNWVEVGGIAYGFSAEQQFRWLRVSLSILRLTPQRGRCGTSGLLYSHTTHGSFAPHACRASQQRLTLQRDLNSAPNLAFLKTTYILQRTFCMELLGTHSRITEVPVCRILKKEIFFLVIPDTAPVFHLPLVSPFISKWVRNLIPGTL